MRNLAGMLLAGWLMIGSAHAVTVTESVNGAAADAAADGWASDITLTQDGLTVRIFPTPDSGYARLALDAGLIDYAVMGYSIPGGALGGLDTSPQFTDRLLDIRGQVSEFRPSDRNDFHIAPISVEIRDFVLLVLFGGVLAAIGLLGARSTKFRWRTTLTDHAEFRFR